MEVANEILIDGFGRVEEVVHRVLKGLSEKDLGFRPGPEANSIAWLVWHLTRVEDDHVVDVAGGKQVWSQGWSAKFKLPFDESATGWNQGSDEVAAVQAGGDLLRGYFDAVHKVTVDYVRGLKPADYARVVDKRWDPPVTLAVRLVSVLDDEMQHAGQAAYVRGLLGK